MAWPSLVKGKEDRFSSKKVSLIFNFLLRFLPLIIPLKGITREKPPPEVKYKGNLPDNPPKNILWVKRGRQ